MLGGADSRNTPEIVYDRLETMLATASLISALRAAQEHRSGTARPAAHPQLLAQYDWVFIGSPGWLIAFVTGFHNTVSTSTIAAVQSNGWAMSTSTRKPSSIGMQKWRSIRLFSKGSGSRPWKQCISAARSCAPIRPVYRKQAATPHSTSTRPRCRASSRPYRQRCGGCASNAGPSRGQPPSGLAFHLARFRPPDRRSNRPDGRRKCCDRPILNTQEIIGFPQPRAEAAV